MFGKRVFRGVETRDVIDYLPSRAEIARRMADETRNQEIRRTTRTADQAEARVDQFGTVTRSGAAGTFQEAAGAIQNEATGANYTIPETVQRSLVAAVEPLVSGFTLGQVLSAEDISETFRLNLGRTYGTMPELVQRALVATTQSLANHRTGDRILSAEDIAQSFRLNLGRVWTGTTPMTTADRIAATQANNESYRRQQSAAPIRYTTPTSIGAQPVFQPLSTGNKRVTVADIQARNEEYRAAKRSGRV
jgi:hypothetical protein